MPQGISIREFARRDGCDDKVVRRKIKSGHLVPFEDGSLDPELVGTGWRQRPRTEPTIADSEETPAEVADRLVNVEGRAVYSKAEAERIKENYLALLRQLEYDRDARKVIEIDDVVTAVVGEYSKVRTKLLNVASRIAPRVAVLNSADEVKALIDKEMSLVLEELTLDGQGVGDPDELRRDIQVKFADPD